MPLPKHVIGREGGRGRLSAEQEALVLDMMKDDSRSMAQVAKLMNVSRSTISRLLERAGGDEDRMPWRPSKRGRQAGGGDEGSFQHSSESIAAWGEPSS